ncbi:MAG: hypothetical protein CMJ83_07215 [Planctomycetes bacterium]|nr:hypothetical protein [Planctomycetota bacterium]
MISKQTLKKLAILSATFTFVASASAQRTVSDEAVSYYKANCISCHTVGGGSLVGPDLRDVSKRKDRAWLIRFIRNPKRMIDAGDPYALKLLKESKGQIMTTIPGLSAAMAGKILDMIEVESELPKGKSRFAGLSIPDRPLTPEDITAGRDLFLGRTAFTRGGPACVACHTASDLTGLGGGTLGPDLTAAFARLEGRKALGAWLSAPPSLVMQPVFKDHGLEGEEILQVVAYLKNVAESGDAKAEDMTLAFLLCGVGGAAVFLVICDFAWRRRYRSVRRPLVNKSGTHV